jgi:hypothetical protein
MQNARLQPSSGSLLNETSDGERHIVLTQNALADGRYLE